MRRAIQQMLFQGKDFSWIRHIVIAVILLTFINLLVIFAPSILGIFGLIGECCLQQSSISFFLNLVPLLLALLFIGCPLMDLLSLGEVMAILPQIP